ncbi:DUF1329 domain-containing protein [Endozoicomonas sp. OPT23]|uniref:DUF1329 domain-containing protein n=1 Tax=Endozoicomonas sp. OPT23 TaxID=2072845 RepID=UPI001E4F47D6|nr:DUF1329 domain-containing protein [Endozoicomonas sp. OPT23]
MNRFKLHHLLALTVSLSVSLPVFSAVDEAKAAQLGKTLTPVGAEKAGNKAGTIPAWTGGLKKEQIPKEFASGNHYINPWPDDKPLFTINSNNIDKYRENLSEGQVALIETYPDTFNMPVYKSRRSAIQPEVIYENTRKAAVSAQLLDGGNGFKGAYNAFPFPIPNNGLEALWNHIVRYRGHYAIRRSSEASVHRNGSYSLATIQQEALFNYNLPDGSEETLNNIIFYYQSMTRSPARLAGGAVLIYETLNQVLQPRQAWAYNAGQRRVRRAPNLAYDTPIAAADGLRTADDTDMYNGAPNRYEWKLLGKKELYIPYNNIELTSPKLEYSDVLGVGHLNPDHTRYELHRVWVVEGNLKPGERHIYKKRVLYLDEDSWGAAVVDQYDSRGDLWRVSMAYLMNYYDVPTTWTGLDVYHDLQSRRYNVQGLANEQNNFVQLNLPIPPRNYFKPSSLRRRGKR